MSETPKATPSDSELVLARAFDRAWESFIAATGAHADTAENRGSLAARLVVLAKLGESDEAALADAAALFMRALAAAKGLKQQAEVAGPPGPVLDPAAIKVASAVYEACLDELPEGISAEARSALLQSILANSGKGVRDSKRLHDLAMEALRSRSAEGPRPKDDAI
jgi:hypothetical protein